MERLSFNSSSSYNAPEAAVHLARYAAAAALCRGRRVLDVACGEGYGSRFLKEAGAQSVVGVDISEQAIESAKLNFGCEGVDFVCANIKDSVRVFTDCKFDMIVSLETFEHLPDPLGLLRSLNMLAEPEGVVIISCPNDHFFYPDPSDSNPYHYRKYRFHEFKEMTAAILGDDVQWYIGSPLIGFGNIPISIKSAAVGDDLQKLMMEYVVQGHSLMVPSDANDGPCAENSAYFMGIWRAGSNSYSSSAFYPIHMGKYSKLIVAGEKYDCLVSELNDSERVRRKNQIQAFALFEENKILKERISILKELEVQNQEMQIELSEIRIELSRYREIKKMIPGSLKKIGKHIIQIAKKLAR